MENGIFEGEKTTLEEKKRLNLDCCQPIESSLTNVR